MLSRVCLAGFWLAILKKETFDLINEICYDIEKMYTTELHNKRGWFEWEREVIDGYFKECKYLLVGAAGGGREVLALRRAGYAVDAFECHPRLVKFANELLKKEGFIPDVKLVPRDNCMASDKIYDGIIIGWSAYGLIQGKRQRVGLLKELQKKIKKGGPIVLSFPHRTDTELRHKATAIIGNMLKRFLWRKDYLERGDNLLGRGENLHFAHYFSQKEIFTELQEGGFRLELYGADSDGYAVGIASNQT